MAEEENENVQLLIVAEKKEFKAVRGVHTGRGIIRGEWTRPVNKTVMSESQSTKQECKEIRDVIGSCKGRKVPSIHRQ